MYSFKKIITKILQEIKRISFHNHTACCTATTTTPVSATAGAFGTITLNKFICCSDSEVFELSGGGVKCLKDGYVYVSAQNHYSQSAAGITGCYLYLNGAEKQSQYRYHIAGSKMFRVGDRIFKVNAGDVFTMKTRGAVATTTTADNGTFMSIFYLDQTPNYI